MLQQTDLALAQAHSRIFATPPQCIQRAPGRVNLIGEHIDYSGGIVLPITIDRFASVSISLGTQPGLICAHTLNLDQTRSISLDSYMTSPPQRGNWSNYVLGTIASMHDLLPQDWLRTHGINLTLHSEVPAGAGLSSSAAIEVAVARSFCALTGIVLDPLELAKRCQHAEHTYAGVPCGLMDQAAASIAPPGKLIAFDCSLEYARIIDRPESLALIVIDSGVRHALEESGYRDRRAAAEEAARLLGVETLHECMTWNTIKMLQSLPKLPQQVAQHALSEMGRVNSAIGCIRDGDLTGLGLLLNESHASLRDVLRVSCAEVDTIVRIAQTTQGVLGARLTGAGFGGCVLALTHQQQAHEIAKSILTQCPASIDASLVLIDP